ncbi:MAG: hypothetical protein V3U52_00990, partial [Thermoplasmata archaeon]
MKNRQTIWLTGLLACLMGLTALTVVPGLFVYSLPVEDAVSEMSEIVPAATEETAFPSQESFQDMRWEAKLDRDLRDLTLKGSKELQDVLIYTADMAELAPLLDKYGVRTLPEEFRGLDSRDVTRVQAVYGGIVSTRVQVPAYAIPEIAKLPGVLGIEKPLEPRTADYTNYDLTASRERIMELREKMQASLVDPVPLDWGIVKAHNVVDAWPTATGDGVYVAVQDWGVDFAHPNLMGSWATVTDPSSPYYGYPIMHSQESLWNNLELFTASSDFDRYPYPSFATFGTASWFSDTSYQATRNVTGYLNYTWGTEYGPFQFTKRIAPTWGDTGLINRSYVVGTADDDWAIDSVSGWYHLGVHKDKYLEGLWGERVGILVVDSTTDGVYDKVYVDLNNDYNFTNDDPLTVTGSPLAALDLD